MRIQAFHCCAALLMAGLAPVAIAQSATKNSAPATAGHHPNQVWFDSTLPLEKRVDALVSSMTLEEKAGQMNNHAPALPRLGVPEYDYWSEGLHGIARSGYSTLFPQAIGMAATWDVNLQHEIGNVVGTEARARYNQAMKDDIHRIFWGLTIWSPNVNIFRDPRCGRGQETYGEDPYLTGRMGVPFVTGLQGNDPKYLLTVATPKYFAVHSWLEPLRHKFNVDVDPHDLEDTYLPAFRATITESKADSIMCVYNAVNGQPGCASNLLLEKYLRGYWKFNGFVTSDCGAITDFYSKNGHHFSPDRAHAAAIAVKTGTDTAVGGSLEDGSVVLTDLPSLQQHMPKDFQVTVNGHIFSGSFEGVFALKTNKYGIVEKLACGSCGPLMRDGRKVLSLKNRADLVLMRNEDGYSAVIDSTPESNALRIE